MNVTYTQKQVLYTSVSQQQDQDPLLGRRLLLLVGQNQFYSNNRVVFGPPNYFLFRYGVANYQTLRTTALHSCKQNKVNGKLDFRVQIASFISKYVYRNFHPLFLSGSISPNLSANREDTGSAHGLDKHLPH